MRAVTQMKHSVWVSFFIPHPIAVFLSFLRLCFFFLYRSCFLSCSLSCPFLFICSVPTDRNLTQSLRATYRSDQIKNTLKFLFYCRHTHTQKSVHVCETDIFPYGLSHLPRMAVMTSRTDRSSRTVTKIKADTFISLACDFFFSHPLHMQRCQCTVPRSSICAA